VIFIKNTAYLLLLKSKFGKNKKLKEQILINESNTVELRKIREIFSKEGFNIMTATDIVTAKDIIEKIPIKYIVSEASIYNQFDLNQSKNNPEEREWKK